MMIIALSFIGSVIFALALLNESLAEVQSKVDVNVYFVTTAEEGDILALKRSLESLPEVAFVEYVSREQALANFKERHANEQLTLQALAELGENPLGATLNIKAKTPSQYEGIAEFLKGDDALSTDGAGIIDTVNYNRHKVAIDRLTRVVDAGEKFGVLLSIVLSLIAVVITFNTIRLTIYVAREEIAVMKLVGASNRYVRGPFVISGIIYGLIAAIVTLALFYPATWWFGESTARFLPSINLFGYYLEHFSEVLLIIVGSGIAIGAISSWLAVRRYLNV